MMSFSQYRVGSGDVSGQREAGERGEGDIVGAPDARFQHSAAPHRHAVRLRERLDLIRLTVSADATELDIDDSARAQLVCVLNASRD